MNMQTVQKQAEFKSFTLFTLKIKTCSSLCMPPATHASGDAHKMKQVVDQATLMSHTQIYHRSNMEMN